MEGNEVMKWQSLGWEIGRASKEECAQLGLWVAFTSVLKLKDERLHSKNLPSCCLLPAELTCIYAKGTYAAGVLVHWLVAWLYSMSHVICWA